MSEVKHTPTPWYRDGSLILKIPEKSTGGFDRILLATHLDTSYQTPTAEESLANAKFIVRAVNSHDALVEALTSIAEIERPVDMCIWDKGMLIRLIKQMEKIAEDALNQAKGA